jgi:iron complex outermembrane receptor protein
MIGKVSAQDLTIITGKAELKDGKPADYANITLIKSSNSTLVKGTLSDENGKYTFENIKPESIILMLPCLVIK